MQFKVGFATDIGRKRTQNQDNMAAQPELGLFMVADGMGGHRGGETASALAIEIVAKHIVESEKDPDWQPAPSIIQAIKHANEEIYHQAFEQPQLQGMGTTITALLFRDGVLTIGHVGDSRCYYLRPEGCWQATRDHSVVQEKLRAGLITREEMKTDRMKNVITRSVGFEPEVNVETYEMNVQPGDTFLLCSDGLSGLVEDSKIAEVVLKRHFGDSDTEGAVRELIEAANANGGDDNITVVMVEVLANGE
jgi:PPM family protein phosphatase